MDKSVWCLFLRGMPASVSTSSLFWCLSTIIRILFWHMLAAHIAIECHGNLFHPTLLVAGVGTCTQVLPLGGSHPVGKPNGGQLAGGFQDSLAKMPCFTRLVWAISYTHGCPEKMIKNDGSSISIIISLSIWLQFDIFSFGSKPTLNPPYCQTNASIEYN